MITLALLVTIPVYQQDPIAFPVTKQVTTTAPDPAADPLDGTYKIYWDDVLDGHAPDTARTVEPPTKTFDLKLKVRGGEMTGEAVVRSISEQQTTSVAGNVYGNGKGANVLSFREAGSGYVRVFQVTLGLGKFVGTWHDTNGGSGDFRILKYQ